MEGIISCESLLTGPEAPDILLSSLQTRSGSAGQALSSGQTGMWPNLPGLGPGASLGCSHNSLPQSGSLDMGYPLTAGGTAETHTGSILIRPYDLRIQNRLQFLILSDTLSRLGGQTISRIDP